MFGRDKEKVVSGKNAADEHAEIVAYLEAAAKSQTAEALAAQDGLLEGFQAQHDADVAGFKFECRRWGDFLALMVERQGSKEMQALHIGAGSVSLLLGNVPDRGGTITFSYSTERTDGGDGYTSCWVDGYGFQLKWPEGAKFVVKPNVPHRSYGYSCIEMKSEKDGPQMLYMGQPYQVSNVVRGHSIPTGARPASDDILHFEKTGANLRVPASLGQTVYGAILAELEKGTER